MSIENSVKLIGRVATEVEIRQSNNVEKPMTIAKFNFGVNSRSKDKKANFFQIVCFGTTAMFVQNYVQKGNLLAIDGNLDTNNYTDKEGKKHYETLVIANDIMFLERKGYANGEYKPANNNNNGNTNGNLGTIPQNNDDIFDNSDPTRPNAMKINPQPWMQIADSVDDGGLPFN